MAVDELGPLDAVLLTHDHHADNLDDAGPGAARRRADRGHDGRRRGRLGGAAIGLEPWETTLLEAPGRPPLIDIVATPCRHGPPLSHPIVGDVIGFGLSEQGSAKTALWISGDTVLFDGVREVADRLHVDVALLHLGGVRFPITGPLHYTMTIDDGIELCRSITPRVAIPVHYEGWSHFRQGRDAIEQRLQNEPPTSRRRSGSSRWANPPKCESRMSARGQTPADILSGRRTGPGRRGRRARGSRCGRGWRR